ncbi:hypothetical protein C8R44DRAFT_742708 [Mycena epipterygia]|nr:hypothetical protein C8R44DRAFT_742708 [Mycena epipterygia]
MALQGKQWKDIPAHIQRIYARAFIVSADIASQILPDAGISLRALLDFSLPRPVTPGKDGSDTSVFFTKNSPDVVNAPAILLRVFELEFRRRFKIIPKHASALGTICFAHLPVKLFLALLPKEEPVKIFQSHLEIGPRAHIMFQENAEETVLLTKLSQA